jgi:hypothetical protein
MPYPESCPECGGTFRNTGTHFTARRNEVGRHVLLELGCQATNRRYWWNFTTGHLNEEGRQAAPITTNGHAASVATVERVMAVLEAPPVVEAGAEAAIDSDSERDVEVEPEMVAETETEVVVAVTPPPSSPTLREAFVRQLQLDRLTLRQMRSWLMAEEARRAIEVAAGATEATYERLALILFGVDLPQLLGKQTAVPASTGMSAEERLELQREKARIRARLRRAAIKAARQTGE